MAGVPFKLYTFMFLLYIVLLSGTIKITTFSTTTITTTTTGATTTAAAAAGLLDTKRQKGLLFCLLTSTGN